MKKILLLIILVSPLFTWGETQVNSFFSFYRDDNQLTVLTPTVHIAHEINPDISLGLTYSFERFDKEAPNVDPTQVDVVVGASTVAGGVGSGFEEDRNELAVTALLNSRIGRIGSGFYTSQEDDFESNGFSLSWSREFAQKNFTLSSFLSLTEDKIFDFDAAVNTPLTKDVITFSISASQLINIHSYVYGGLSIMNVDGYQSSPLRSILTEQAAGNGTIKVPVEERHPDLRERANLFFGYKRYFLNRSALDTSLSLYDDSWGVGASGIKLGYYRYLNPKIWTRLRMQYYSQTQANFYAPVYTDVQSIMTADNRLRKFDSRMLGIKLAYKINRSKLRDWQLSFAYDWYSETNDGLTANIYKIMLKMVY